MEITEFEYISPEWTKPRRVVTVRQKIAQRSQAVGKQLSLFDNETEVNGYRYTCYVTSMTIGAAEVWRLYRGRANCENRIKELKYDYGLDKVNQHSFNGTEVTMACMAVAYNFMSLFRQTVVSEKVRNRLSTLRHKILAIPAMIEKKGNGLVIKMALQMRRSAWIITLWERGKNSPFAES